MSLANGRLQYGRRRRFGILLCAAVVAISGCTTVSRTGVGSSTGLSAGGGSVPGSVGAGGVLQGGTGSAGSGPGANGALASGGTGSAAGTGGTGGGSGAVGSGGSASSAGGGSGGGSSGAAGVPASSSSPCTVRVGTDYIADAGEAGAIGNPTIAYEYANYAQAFEQAYNNVAKWFSTHGGFGADHCAIQMYYAPFYLFRSDGYSGESETACTTLTEDDHVFMAFGQADENGTWITCLYQHKAVDFYNGIGFLPTPQLLAQYRGYLYQPDVVDPYRFAPYIKALADAGYFRYQQNGQPEGPTGAKVGILVANDGSGTDQYMVNTLWKPELQAMGINPVIFTFSQYQGLSDAESIGQQFSSAVLQFKAAGVDHVMFTADAGDASFYFTQAAHGQQYHPRYSLLGPQSQPETFPTAMADQRANAMLVTSVLSEDVGVNAQQFDQTQEATNSPNSSRDTCNTVFNQTPKNPFISSPVSLYAVCDIFLLTQKALAGTTQITPQSLLTGVNALGNSFPLADGSTSADFGSPGHYDGATSVRVLNWDEAAGEFKYVSSPIMIPPS